MKKVYICSPCRGDYENNIQRAKEFSRAAGMAAEIELARERGIPVHNGYERITGTGGETADDGQKDEKPEIGSVTLHLPAFKAMAVCNQHLDHGPITVKLDGGIILDLADRLRMDPGTDIEIGG